MGCVLTLCLAADTTHARPDDGSPTAWFPRAPVSFAPDGPMVTCQPVDNHPDAVAQVGDQVATAEYYRKSSLFLLMDGRQDGRSAVLQLRISGVLAEPEEWANSKGWTCHGRQHMLPKVIRPNLLKPEDTVQFRVCVEDREVPSAAQLRCGDWVLDGLR